MILHLQGVSTSQLDGGTAQTTPQLLVAPLCSKGAVAGVAGLLPSAHDGSMKHPADCCPRIWLFANPLVLEKFLPLTCFLQVVQDPQVFTNTAPLPSAFIALGEVSPSGKPLLFLISSFSALMRTQDSHVHSPMQPWQLFFTSQAFCTIE